MFKKIMVPVDLRHIERLGRALQAAADLARLYSASVCYVSVTTSEPNEFGHTPQEAARHFADWGQAEAERRGHAADTRMVVSHDPTVELDKALIDTIDTLGADLVVMATHMPNVADYIWASHGGTLAMHSCASVMLLRG
ncbi:universal stress protein [Defluviimonas sp. SAOS-178_SWC]|uniref:universal stress protein n=1 Tax=Defluviimonas sp. SAOS-178_SWC TaxID=3121287 RepID=UPI003221973D